MKFATTFLTVILFSQIGLAQLSPVSVSIPMDDGKVLAGDLYLPNDTDEFPTILIQTPYSKGSFLLTGLPLGVDYDISTSDYAFLVVDWRCYFQSLSACTLNFSRGEDGYAIVEWIAQQSWSDGKVGTWGPSALGSIQFQTAREQPPHLVCSVPIVVSPQTRYQKYFQGGSARVDYLDFVFSYFGFGDLITSNPYYNLIWTITENGSMYPSDIEVPMLIIGGWFDHNTDDCLLMFDTLRNASEVSVRDQHRLLMGPWTHNRVGNPNQAELSFLESGGWHDSLALVFFDYHLRGVANDWDNSPAVQYYQIGDNEWRSSESWPQADFLKALFLHDDQTLQPEIPTFSSAQWSYVYDPEDPSPSVGGKVFDTNLFQPDAGPRDQSVLVESRNDNLIFSTEALEDDLAIEGVIEANLHFSSDRIDTDLALRLTDVYPDGRSMLISESILRMHCRDGFRIADTAYMNPGTVYFAKLQFDPLSYTFKEGHQLRLIVTSSNYPRFNRNMNTGGPMYPNGNFDTLVNPLIATNRIYAGEMHTSALLLPVVETTVDITEVPEQPMIKAYPIPARDQLFLEGLPEWRALQLFNAQGQQVWADDSGGTRPTYQLSVKNWPKGVYFLKVKSKTGSIMTSTIVVQ